MKPPALAAALEDALGRLGVRVRRGRGAFHGGRCVVEGQETVVVNTQHPPEAQLAVLAGALRELPHETLYLRPAVRAAVEAAWAQMDLGPPDDGLPDDGLPDDGLPDNGGDVPGDAPGDAPGA